MCDALKLKEDNLHLARAIEHKAYFSDESRKEEVITKLKEAFEGYINVALNFLKKEGVESFKKESTVSLEMIIYDIKRV